MKRLIIGLFILSSLGLPRFARAQVIETITRSHVALYQPRGTRLATALVNVNFQMCNIDPTVKGLNYLTIEHLSALAPKENNIIRIAGDIAVLHGGLRLEHGDLYSVLDREDIDPPLHVYVQGGEGIVGVYTPGIIRTAQFSTSSGAGPIVEALNAIRNPRATSGDLAQAYEALTGLLPELKPRPKPVRLEWKVSRPTGPVIYN